MPERSLLHTISGTSDNWIGARPKPCELTKNKINNPAAHQQCKQNTDHNRNNPISTIRGLSPFRLALVCVAPTPIQKRRLLPIYLTSRRGPLLPMARVARRVIAIDIDSELLNVASVLQYQCGDMLERSRSFSSTLLDNGRTILLIEPLP